MSVVFNAALELQTFCREKGWKFCFIGGVALQRWGEPGQTVDVENVLIKQQDKLNLDLVRLELKPLVDLKQEPEILGRIEQMISRLEKRSPRTP